MDFVSGSIQTEDAVQRLQAELHDLAVSHSHRVIMPCSCSNLTLNPADICRATKTDISLGPTGSERICTQNVRRQRMTGSNHVHPSLTL